MDPQLGSIACARGDECLVDSRCVEAKAADGTRSDILCGRFSHMDWCWHLRSRCVSLLVCEAAGKTVFEECAQEHPLQPMRAGTSAG